LKSANALIFLLGKLWISFENFASNVTFSLLLKFFVYFCTWSK